MLYYLYQYDTKEIARITGTNQPLVKMRLSGPAKLKRILLENGVVSHE